MTEGLYFAISLILTAVLMPWVRKVSLRMGYVDTANGDTLKIHVGSIPHSGGVAIFMVFGVLILFLWSAGDLIGVEAFGLLLGGSIAFGLGVWDDLKPTQPAIRLGIMTLAGLVLVLVGLGIETPLFTGLLLTLFYVVGAINAVNMEDGLDGLAGGMASLSCVGFAFLFGKIGEPAGLTVSLVFCGVLVGFIFYNFNPSSIFMGDSGSYFVGFVLAYLAVSLTSLSHWSTFIAPIVIIGVPVFDTAYAILRRLENGVSPITGDRSHFYDLLMQKGLTVRQTVLICWAIQGLMVGSGVILYLG